MFEVIEAGRDNDPSSQIFDGFLIVLILLNVVAFAAETVPSLEEKYHAWFLAFEAFSVTFFTFEYLLRLWAGVEMPFLKQMPVWKARLNFALRPFLILDLLVILPFYLSFLFPLLDLRVLRLFRVLRVLKLARYSPALHTLIKVVANERRALLGALILTLTMLLFSATGIYFIEHKVPGSPFTSVPEAAWWAMATLTTVGYGDVIPLTPLGKMFGAIVMLIGLGLFALPIAIISTGFAQESSRRDFVVTWSMLSRIPLFAKLNARAIAELVNVLQSHTYPPRWEVVRAGEPGHAMYFIITGEILIERNDAYVTLHSGDFFGEIAMLDQQAYKFTFSTLAHTKILELNYDDYQRLCRLQPEICEHIKTIAEARRRARKAAREEGSGHADG
jgi:voltage-gated potassium channel